MGECPDWYLYLQAAKYLEVPAWDLVRQPVIWRNWALAAMRSEEHAKAQHNRLRNMFKRR